MKACILSLLLLIAATVRAQLKIGLLILHHGRYNSTADSQPARLVSRREV